MYILPLLLRKIFFVLRIRHAAEVCSASNRWQDKIIEVSSRGVEDSPFCTPDFELLIWLTEQVVEPLLTLFTKAYIFVLSGEYLKAICE